MGVWTKRALTLAAVTIAGWLGLSVLAAERLTRPHAPYQETLPTIVGVTTQALSLETSDGLPQTLWHFYRDDRAPRADPVVVLLHPNGGSRSGMVQAAAAWGKLGFNAVMITQRAHGDAPSVRNDFGWSARRDAALAIEYAASTTTGTLVVHGVSLGAASAVFALAGLTEASRGRIDGLVLESPYTSLHAAVADRTAAKLPPVLDGLAATGLRIVAPLFLAGWGAIDPLGAFTESVGATPTLVLSGREDSRSPAARTAKYAEAGASVTLVERDLGHIGWLAEAATGALYDEDLTAWLTTIGKTPTPFGSRTPR